MRNRKSIALVAAADLMACFIGILFLLIRTESAELEDKKAGLEEEIVQLESEISEGQSAKEKLEEEIRNLRSKKWKVIKSNWHFDNKKRPDANKLFVLRDGLYTDPAGSSLTDAQVTTYLATNRGVDGIDLYVQNGANDNLLRAQSLAQRGGLKGFSLYVLPEHIDPKL